MCLMTTPSEGGARRAAGEPAGAKARAAAAAGEGASAAAAAAAAAAATATALRRHRQEKDVDLLLKRADKDADGLMTRLEFCELCVEVLMGCLVGVKRRLRCVRGQRPICFPGPSEGSGRSYSLQKAARPRSLPQPAP